MCVRTIRRATHLQMKVTCRLLSPSSFLDVWLEVIGGTTLRYVPSWLLRSVPYLLSCPVVLYVPDVITVFSCYLQLRFLLDGEECADLCWCVATFTRRQCLWRVGRSVCFPRCARHVPRKPHFSYVLGSDLVSCPFYRFGVMQFRWAVASRLSRSFKL